MRTSFAFTAVFLLLLAAGCDLFGGDADAGSACGAEGCCCTADGIVEASCVDGQWTCGEGTFAARAACDDVCGECANPGLLGSYCCNEAGMEVGTVACTSANGHYCTEGTREACPSFDGG